MDCVVHGVTKIRTQLSDFCLLSSPSLSCISLSTAGSVGYYESNSGPHKAVYALTEIEAFRI